MTDLLPCPFCGSNNVDVGASQELHYSDREWSVICTSCGSSCSLHCHTEQDAIASWNTRAHAQQAPKPSYPVGEANKKLATDWYTWGFQAGMDAARNARIQTVQRDNMARLSASEVACYRWPEDTAEHRALREAFCDGALYQIVEEVPANKGLQEETLSESGIPNRTHAQRAPLPVTAVTERLIQAAVDYESGRCSRRELSEARAAVEAAILANGPASPDICETCMGSGYSNHPDSGEICHTCNGQGVVQCALPTDRPHDPRAVHIAHCNQGEYLGECKYGDENCPAFSALPSTVRGDT